MTQTLTRSDLFTRDRLFIGGQWTQSDSRGHIDIVDPFTEQVIGTIPEANEADADEAIRIAVEAAKSNPWQKMSFRERGVILARIGDELQERAADLAETYVHELGGLRVFSDYITAGTVEIFREHQKFAEQLENEPIWRESGGERNLILREPVGPVLAILPWNAPLILGAVKIAPALLAGCPVVVKIPPEDPAVSFIFAEAIEAAGVPAGMISFLPGNRRALGNIAARPEFGHIAFTGSTESGRTIMRGAAENITAVTLELGGKSAGIFLDDIDPADGAPLVVPGSLGQSGQVCTTYSRLLVPESRKQEWFDAIARVFASLPIGDPNEKSTAFGPLISANRREKVEQFIEIARQEGATILTGGKRPADQPTGYFIEPTLITDVPEKAKINQEEVFGPVITIQSYRDIDDAVRIANSTEFGLAAGVFTSNVERGIEIGKRLEAGSIGINNFGACLVQPFGGYKQSGLGREGGIENVHALMEIKQIRMPMQSH